VQLPETIPQQSTEVHAKGTSKDDREEGIFSRDILKDFPADVVGPDDQLEDVKEIMEEAKSDLSKALKIDGGVSKSKYFVFVKEDKKKYLTIPSNSRDLIKLPGWDALFGLLNELNVAMKLSGSEYKNPGSSEETKKFIAGLVNRISKSDWDPDEDKFIISATKAAERGRATADLYALKKTSSVMNLEKYLPSSSRIGNISYIRFYLSQLSGSNSTETLKAIPDLVNKIMGNWVDKYHTVFEAISGDTTLSIGQVVNDLTRKRKKKEKRDGKIVEVSVPIHAARVSESPFAITEEEIDHLQRLEQPWNELKLFNDTYADGVPITEIEEARTTYKKEYENQMEFAQKTGSFKARRMEAFKELASFSMSNKEMKEFKLTKKTREIALDNFAKAIQQYDSDKKESSIALDKVLVNMRPSNIPGFTAETWNLINGENLLHLYGKLVPSNRRRKWLLTRKDEIHDELVKYFPSVANLTVLGETLDEESKDKEDGGDY
jgi:hypothetical protein